MAPPSVPSSSNSVFVIITHSNALWKIQGESTQLHIYTYEFDLNYGITSAYMINW